MSKYKLSLIFLFIFLCVSCSFQSDSFCVKMAIKDISKDTSYKKVATQGFMGGSLIYNMNDISLGQITDGVSIAIRLSNAKATDVGDDQVVFGEMNDSVQYGLLIVKSVDIEHITLLTRLYDMDGSTYSEKYYTIFEGQSIDINEDAKVDLQYKIPNQKRSGYECAVYLNFISSQEELNITMFAVLTEQYPGQTYPNGIIGVNPNGRFIITKYSNNNGISRSVIRGVYKGDYVIDSVNGKYQQVINNSYTRNARSVSDKDLEDMEDNIDDENFYFTKSDFANYSIEDLIAVIPNTILLKYENYEGIDKLNKILEDSLLVLTVDKEQGSVLPNLYKNEIIDQFGRLTVEETVKLNRIFLEKNYQLICPQRVTVSDSMIEILPLASVNITEDDMVPEMDFMNSEYLFDSNRAATASWSSANNKLDYDVKLQNLEQKYSQYKEIKKFDLQYTFKPSEEKSEHTENKSENDKKDTVVSSVTTTVGIKDGKVGVGIKGSFNITWTSVSASLGAAVFFKAGTNVDINVKPNIEVNPSWDFKNDENNKEKIEEGEIDVRDIPVVNITKKIWEYEIKQSYNLLHFFIGPILITINLDTGLGVPVDLFIEANTSVSYDIYMGALAQVGVSVNFGYGVNWEKVWWFIYKPVFYSYSNADAYASADAVYYVDTTGKSFDIKLNSLETGIGISPYAKAEINLCVAALVHGGFGVKSGVKGETRFGYENPYITGKYSLKYNNKLYANVFLGLKDVKILGLIKIGDIGKNWEWDFLKKYPNIASGVIIPETVFFRYKLH